MPGLLGHTVTLIRVNALNVSIMAREGLDVKSKIGCKIECKTKMYLPISQIYSVRSLCPLRTLWLENHV